ncbi:MAG: carbamate kinase [Bacilli bacterium]
MSRIVVALGGNALGNNPEEQLGLLENTAKIIVKLITLGHDVILTHGNGPQVGQISLAMEYSHSGINTPYMPFAECGSMSQGYIGYQLQQVLENELKKQHIAKSCVTVITQVLVDAKDQAFKNPTKPIGAFYSKEEAKKIAKEKKQTFVSDAGRGFRRVVPSPKPIDILEKKAIKLLVDNGVIVIATGGGGIPVIKDKKTNNYKGVDAVIDKDKTASLMAKELNADMLLILTAIPKVCLNFNQENELPLNEMTVAEAKQYIKNNEFAPGSMLPKIEACIDFVKDDSKKVAMITSLKDAFYLDKKNIGTKIIKGGEKNE